MKMINAELIKRKSASLAAYERGNDLFVDECAGRLDIQRLTRRSYKVGASVKGSNGTHYSVQATVVYLAKEELIKDYSCGCMAFGQQEGLCRHLVAMLMEFNYKAEDGELDQYDDQEPIFEKRYEIPLKQVPKEPAKPSDQELKKLVDYYVLCDRNQFCQEYGNGNIRLEPTLHLEMERESLELKIGTTQLYVIKDIAQLIDDIKQMRYVTYGKKLAFTHTQSAFTRE